MIALTAISPVFAFLDMLGGSELLVIFLLVLVFFGGEKMPEFARGLGKAIREFRKAASGVEQEFKKALEEEPTTSAPTPTILPPRYTAPADSPHAPPAVHAPTQAAPVPVAPPEAKPASPTGAPVVPPVAKPGNSAGEVDAG